MTAAVLCCPAVRHLATIQKCVWRALWGRFAAKLILPTTQQMHSKCIANALA